MSSGSGRVTWHDTDGVRQGPGGTGPSTRASSFDQFPLETRVTPHGLVGSGSGAVSTVTLSDWGGAVSGGGDSEESCCRSRRRPGVQPSVNPGVDPRRYAGVDPGVDPGNAPAARREVYPGVEMPQVSLNLWRH